MIPIALQGTRTLAFQAVQSGLVEYDGSQTTVIIAASTLQIGDKLLTNPVFIDGNTNEWIFKDDDKWFSFSQTSGGALSEILLTGPHGTPFYGVFAPADSDRFVGGAGAVLVSSGALQLTSGDLTKSPVGTITQVTTVPMLGNLTPTLVLSSGPTTLPVGGVLSLTDALLISNDVTATVVGGDPLPPETLTISAASLARQGGTLLTSFGNSVTLLPGSYTIFAQTGVSAPFTASNIQILGALTLSNGTTLTDPLLTRNADNKSYRVFSAK